MQKDFEQLIEHKDFLGEEYENLLKNFQSEIVELIHQLETMFFEKDHYPSQEDLNLAMRLLHTLKGTSAQFKLTKTSKFIHSIEDIFCSIRDGSIKFKPGTYQTLVPFLQCLKQMVLALSPDTFSKEEFLSKLRTMAFYFQVFQRLYVGVDPKPKTAKSTKTKDDTSHYAGLLDFIKSSSESVADAGTKRHHTYGIREQDLDMLTNSMCSALYQLISSPQDTSQKSVLEKLEDAIVTLQATRQVNMSPLEGKVESLLYDLANRLGKKILVKAEGFGEINIDVTWFQIVSDCLTHLCRNAIDHGIELPHERVAKGKEETGNITIGVSQNGGRIVLHFQEDGKGLDGEKIAERAIEKSVLTVAEAESLNYYEKQALIFHPGFSSNDQVTDLSGRGVGMDVIRTQVESSGGSVYFDSEVNQFTKFDINIPIGFYQESSVLFRFGNNTYSISKDCIVGCFYANDVVIDMGAIETKEGDIYTLLHLKEIDRFSPLKKKQCFLAINLSGTPTALGVDEMLGTFDLFFFPIAKLKEEAAYLGSTSYSKELGKVLGIDRFYLLHALNNLMYDEEHIESEALHDHGHNEEGHYAPAVTEPMTTQGDILNLCQDQNFLNQLLNETQVICPGVRADQLIIPLSQVLDELTAILITDPQKPFDLSHWMSWRQEHFPNPRGSQAKMLQAMDGLMMKTNESMLKAS